MPDSPTEFALAANPLLTAAFELEAFLESRTEAAELSHTISRLERDRTKLRHKLAKELMAPPTSLAKTAAMDSARLTDEYQNACEKIEESIMAWERRFTQAEGHRMRFQLLNLQIKSVYDAANASAELQRIQGLITGRIRQLDEGTDVAE